MRRPSPDLNAHDDPRLHYIDTVVGGGYVNERALVRALVEEAPARLAELWDFGAPFRKRDGHYHLSPSGDHSRSARARSRRTCAAPT